MEFTNHDQYIMIPRFVPKAGSPIVPISFTLSFWLKIKDEPNNAGFIFWYSRSNVLFCLRK